MSFSYGRRYSGFSATAFLAAVVLSACTSEPDLQGRSVGAQADSVVVLLQNHEWSELAAYVHPDRGVLFSPDAYVEPDDAVVFSREEVRDLAQDTELYLWGNEDGTGDSIRLTPSAFMEEHITDRDFTAARRGSRDEVMGRSNTLNNVPDAFHDQPPGMRSSEEITFIEYHIPGSSEFGEMDWASLRLVFQREDDTWYLVGVVRDNWTI